VGDENILFTSKYSFSPDHYLKVRLKCIIDYVLHGNFPKTYFLEDIYYESNNRTGNRQIKTHQ